MDKIMIIDDNKDYLFSMETFLKRNGFDVVTACEGETAMDLIQKEKPKIVLLDVMMEALYTGFEIWRQMNADPELKKIPIIGISGMADELGVRVDMKKDHEYFNPDVFLDKPVDRDLLLKKIDELLKSSK